MPPFAGLPARPLCSVLWDFPHFPQQPICLTRSPCVRLGMFASCRSRSLWYLCLIGLHPASIHSRRVQQESLTASTLPTRQSLLKVLIDGKLCFKKFGKWVPVSVLP